MFELKRINRFSRGLAFVTCIAVAMSFVFVSTLTNVEATAASNFTSVSIQGRLKDGSGNPLLSAGTVIVVNLYDADTGGTLLYSDEHAIDLSVTNGFYVLPFGEGTNPSGSFPSLDEALRNNTYVWFTLNVAPDGSTFDGEMSPRTRLQGSAFAHNSFTLDGSRYVKDTESGGSPSGFGTPQAGDLWYDETNNTLNYFDGGSWVGTGGGGGGGFLPLAGGVMVGNIDMGAADIFNATTIVAGSFSGDGSGLSNIDPLSFSGTVGEAVGGTGQNNYATGDMLYASAANVLAKLPAGGAGDVLTMVGGVPLWQASAGGGDFQSSGVVPMTGDLNMNGTGGPHNITGVNDVAAATFTGGGAALTGLDGTNIATGVVGEMFGGTGQAVYAAGDILFASSPTVLAKLPIQADGDVLTLSGGVPTWQAPGGGGFPLLGPDGAVGTPSYSFSSDNTTGIFAPAAGEIGFAIAGVEKIVTRPTGVEFKSFVAPSSVRFLGDPNSTVFQLPDDGVSLTTPAAADEGSLRWNLAGDVVEVWDGAAWVPVGGAGGGDFFANGSVPMTGNLDMNGAGGPHDIIGANNIAAATFTGNGNGLTSLSGSNIGSGVVGAPFGGTGQGGYTAGDILFASGPTTLNKLAIAADGDVLTLSGGLPTWQAGGGGDFLADGTVQMSGTLQGVDGALADPGFKFFSDAGNTGMFKQSISEIGFSVEGADIFTIRGGVNPQVFGTNGSTANPAYSFKFGTDSGMWFGNPGLNFSAGATHVFEMTNAGALEALVQGGAGAPTYTFDASNDTGLWLPGPGELGISAQGTDVIRVRNDRIGVGTTAPIEFLHVDRSNDGGGPITTAVFGEDTFGDGFGVRGESLAGATVNTGGQFRADGGGNTNYGIVGLAGGVVSPSVSNMNSIGVYGEIDDGPGLGGYAGYFTSQSTQNFSAGVFGEAAASGGSDHTGGQFRATGASNFNIGVEGRADDSVGQGSEHIGGIFTSDFASVRNFGVAGITGSQFIPSIAGAIDVAVYGETDIDDSFAAYFVHNAMTGANSTALYAESIYTGGGGTERTAGEFIASGASGTNYGMKIFADDSAGLSATNNYGSFIRVTGGNTLNIGIDAVVDATGQAATTHTGGQFRATGAGSDNYGVVGLAGGLFNPGLPFDTGTYGETDLSAGYGVIASNSGPGPLTGAALWADIADTSATNVVAKFTTGAGANPIVTMQADGFVGIGTATPGAVLDVAGAIATPVTVQGANYNVVSSDSVILANAGGITITLPNPATSLGHRYTVKNISAGAVTVATAAGNIDAVPTKALSAQFDGFEVVSDGVDWFIVAEVGGGAS